MFCQKCGNELNDGAAFCPKCGTKIGGEEQTNNAYVNSSPSVTRATYTSEMRASLGKTKTPSGNKLRNIIIIVAVCFVLLIVMGKACSSGGKSSQGQSSTSSDGNVSAQKWDINAVNKAAEVMERFSEEANEISVDDLWQIAWDFDSNVGTFYVVFKPGSSMISPEKTVDALKGQYGFDNLFLSNNYDVEYVFLNNDYTILAAFDENGIKDERFRSSYVDYMIDSVGWRN